jgi:hypothetical protein
MSTWAGTLGVQSARSSSGSRGSFTHVQNGLVLGVPLYGNSMPRIWFRNLRAAISSFGASCSRRRSSLTGRCSRLCLRAWAIRALRCCGLLRLVGVGAAHAGPRGNGKRSARPRWCRAVAADQPNGPPDKENRIPGPGSGSRRATTPITTTAPAFQRGVGGHW